jgi:hypothetical protein
MIMPNDYPGRCGCGATVPVRRGKVTYERFDRGPRRAIITCRACMTQPEREFSIAHERRYAALSDMAVIRAEAVHENFGR